MGESLRAVRYALEALKRAHFKWLIGKSMRRFLR